MSFDASRADGLIISDDPERLDLRLVTSWLATTYWAADRDAGTIERSVRNSHCYGVYAPSGAQVALTRVTTDLATFAWLGDVFVEPARRGEGIGSWLVRSVVAHLTELGVPRMVLATRDAHEVYARVGFEPLRVPSLWMEIDLRAGRPDPADFPALHP